MHAELESYRDQFVSIRQEVPGLVAGLADAQFNWQPSADRWSIAQCLDHLNLTASRFVPAIDETIAEARRRGWLSGRTFTYPLLERWFVGSQEPPPRMRSRAFKRFVPLSGRPLAEVVPAFFNWQDQFIDRLAKADGVDLARARHKSPVLPIVSWSLGTMFAITCAHERRHLWQARQVRNDPRFPG